MQQILELSASGIGVLHSTHDPDHALIGADRVVLFHSGGILESGSAGQVVTPQNMKTLYGVEVDLAKIEVGRTPRTLCVPRKHGNKTVLRRIRPNRTLPGQI